MLNVKCWHQGETNQPTNQPGSGTIVNCTAIIANNRWLAFPDLQKEKDGEGEKKIQAQVVN